LALFRMTKINNFMNEYKLNQGIGLPIAIIIIALALAGGGGSYYVIKRQAKQAREAQERALREGDAKLKEMRMMRDAMTKSDDAMMEKEGGMMVPGYEGIMTDKEVTHMIDLTAQNFSFSKSEIRVKKGEKIELTFEVKEGYHDWTLEGYNVRTKKINAGGEETIEFTANKAGTFEYYCSVGSHRAMGMTGRLIVE